MDLGLFMMPLHDQRRNFTEMLKQDREAVIIADRLNFSEVWVGEHTSCSCEPIADPLQFFASLIHATKQIKFATGVLNLPQQHPAHVAARVAQFDHLSEGRYIMGVGPGGLVSDMELYGTLGKNTAEMTADSIELMHQIWASDPPYDIHGKYWDVVIKDNIYPDLGFGTMLKPYQKPYPELAISVMSPSSKTAYQAGARGWSMVSTNFTPTRNIRTHWEQYVRGCESVGARPDRNKWRVARSLLVGDSDAEVQDYLAQENSSYLWYYDYIVEDMKAFNLTKVLKASDDTPDDQVTARSSMELMVTSGSSKTVLDKLVSFVDEIGGPFGTLLLTQKDWDNPALHKRSMELLATEVMPKLRQHCSTLSETV